MKLLLRYLRQRRRVLMAVGMGCLLFLVSFLLYHLPAGAVLYPAALCGVLGLMALAADFRRVKRKHELLERVHSLTDVITGPFPRAEGVEDRDYQRILRLLCEEHNRFRGETDRRYADMVDYYTVWAHQIKTPIAAIRLHLQNEDSPLSHKLSPELFRIEQYVEMVLMFLRLDAESTDYVIRSYDLDEILRRAVKNFAGEFIGRRLKLNYEPVCATVVTDEKWLSFVIEQVLSNALKYTHTGGISITMGADRRLRIRDTGIGIAPEDLPRIFENGYTGYNGRADHAASGIGLYLCRRICTNLGHAIWAESQVDVGTEIIIDLAQTRVEAE